MGTVGRAGWRQLARCTAALLTLALCSCTGETTEPTRNLILVSIDTLRADHLGCYGYTRDTSPEIDRMGARGVRFENVSAVSPWTLPSHFSMLSGRSPRDHGVDRPNRAARQDLVMLQQSLAEAGFSTAGFVNVSFLMKRGLRRGFQLYQFVPPATQARGSAPTLIESAIAWMRDHRDRRFFVFLHLYDVHSDYNPLPSFREQFTDNYSGLLDGTTEQLVEYRKRGHVPAMAEDDAQHLRDLYDAEIRQLDHELGRLFAWLVSESLDRETAVILTSDHGEEFLDHGGVLHGRTLYRELIEIPLIVTAPGPL